MTKRILAGALSLALAAGLLAGCGGSAASAPASSDASPAPQATDTPAPAAAAEADHNILTGSAHSGAQPRPIAVMLNNRESAWNQWGVCAADLVVEALFEGKTSTLMAVYGGYNNLPDKVGPVAEGRDTFWQMVMPYNAMPVQIGSNIYAANLLNYYSYQPIEASSAGTHAFEFDEERGLKGHEFGWYINQERLEDARSLYGMAAESETALPDLFHFGENAQGGSAAERIEIQFAPDDVIPLLYNEDEGTYDKYRADWEPQTDGNDEEAQLSFTNVFVLSCRAGIKDDGYTRDYDLTSGGEGLYLTGGTWQKIRWEKGTAAQAFAFYNEAGQELTVAPGKSYIALYGGFDGQSVMVKSGDEKLNPLNAMEPLPTPVPTATPEPTEEPTPAPEEEGGDETGSEEPAADAASTEG